MDRTLTEELEALQPIPRQSAEAFRKELNALVDRVNQLMTARQDLRGLIGKNGLEVMLDNHRNHAALMQAVFLLDLPTLLVDVLPWAYRTYRSRGFSADYFPAHLEAWIQALEERLEPGAAAPLQQVYEVMRGRHGELAAMTEASFEQPAAPEGQDPDESRERFHQALLQGDRRTTMAISREWAARPEDLGRFYTEIMQPAMYRIGDLWERGRITVAKEHLASALANTVMASQYLEVLAEAEPSHGRIVVAAAANEFHVLGAQMVANCLESEGWEVDFLGADTPVGDLVAAVRDRTPAILALSVAMPSNLLKAKETIDRIGQELGSSRPWIMVGGLAFAARPQLSERIGADGYAEDCRGAVALAKTWQEP